MYFSRIMKHLKLSIALLVMLACVSVPADAQKKTKTTEKKEEVKPPPPPPPELIEGIKDVDEPEDEMVLPEMEVDFDTTAVVEDNFTARIRYLLNVIGAAKTDIEMAEASLTENLKDMDTTVSGPFKRKFMEEMTTGRAALWLERLYIRNYREIFTPAEIEGLIEFYKTPLGMALLKKQPLLLQKVMINASKIGRYLGMQIMNDLMN